MLVKNTDVYRRILDHGSVAASGVSALLVEKLSKKIDKDELKTLVQEASTFITRGSDILIDSLQKEEALAEKLSKKSERKTTKRTAKK